jgi:DNA-binding XRE family transcriptional regulator
MPKSKPTEDELEERIARAQEWGQFRQEFGFTQKSLADTLKSIDTDKTGKLPGVSRRTIQMIEAGLIKPHAHTLALFEELKRRHERNKDR